MKLLGYFTTTFRSGQFPKSVNKLAPETELSFILKIGKQCSWTEDLQWQQKSKHEGKLKQINKIKEDYYGTVF